MLMMDSLYQDRIAYKPTLPKELKNLSDVSFEPVEQAVQNNEEMARAFPHLFGIPKIGLAQKKNEGRTLRVGVVLSGGQAAGGHNVIAGFFDAIKKIGADSTLIGFLNGPGGIIDGKCKELTADIIAAYRNTGGFDIIGSGRTKIETEEQLAASLQVIQKLSLDGLVVIGGDDSNTNAAILGEYLLSNGCQTVVVGVPKTIDGDLQTEDVEISFGFDTATKTYAEMIGNIGKDALSAKKYFHFVKLMGRSASHIALECALKTHPNYTFISEEIAEKKKGLSEVVAELADCIEQRAKAGKNYGIALIPEGLIEFIPEMKELIGSLNELLAKGKGVEALPQTAKNTFDLLPEGIQKQLLLDRDPHGNVQVSHIETEKLLIDLVKNELKRRDFKGKFSPVHHFFGYEGRSGYPSLFDATYCYALGFVAALLVRDRKNGYMASLQHLSAPSHEWRVTGVPIPSLFTFEVRKGKRKPVIKKALVDMKSAPFQTFVDKRGGWMLDDAYHVPGPIQFYGPDEITLTVPHILKK